MKVRSKRIKLSVLTQIALLFMVALILSIVVAFSINRNYLLNDAAKDCKDMARIVAISAETVIGVQGGPKDLMESEESRERIHRAFRYICSRSDVKYLYLYTVDENWYKHYIICAAESDEDDRRMNEEYGFGSVNRRPLYDAEISVLNGNLEGDYEFVNNDYGNVCMFVLPVTDAEGRIMALIGVDYSMENIIEFEHKDTVTLLVQVALTMAVAYVITLLLLKRSVISPILVLSERMRNFVRNRDVIAGAGAHSLLFENEITDIEESFDKMAVDIYGYVEDIKSLAGEKAQRDAQLDIARKIQLGLIPQEYFCAGAGYEAYACEDPAREVGGDFYDIFRPDEDHICMIVGDISGKGISAALVMVMIRMAIIEKINHGDALDETLNRVNNEICARNTENMFATVFVMMLNTKTGLLTYANAGHEAPVFLGSEVSFLKMQPGMAIGLFEDADIVTEEIKLNDGEGILIYTDGVTDSTNADMEQYGKENLVKTVYGAYTENGNLWRADKVVKAVTASLKEYSKNREQFDDITCTAIVFNKNDGKELSSDIASFNAVKQEMISALGDNDESRRMILACEEIFANIISYSGADDVSFACIRMGQVYSVTFSDNGVPFDPVNAYIREKSFEELDTGGMGIKLAKMNSSDMVYTRVNNRNNLTLKFDIKGGSYGK